MSQVVRGKVNVVSYISSFDVNDESDVSNTDFKWWFSFATFLIELEFEDADFYCEGRTGVPGFLEQGRTRTGQQTQPTYSVASDIQS